MNLSKIRSLRLYHQQLSTRRFDKPADVVKWFGAMQAQDYLGSLWAVGTRVKDAIEADVEQAIFDKEIIRTWPLRGTLHFVSANDARWMLELSNERISTRHAKRMKQEFDLDEKVFTRSKKILEKEFKNNDQLSRETLYAVLEKSKINTGSSRGLHIISKLARDGFICFGSRMGKQQTFVLLDEWIKPTKKILRKEALAKLALQYFVSRGPATLQDFIWWSGLSPAEAKEGIELTKSKLLCDTTDNQDYWFSPESNTNSVNKKDTRIYLLPSFDEYLIAYSDRSASLDKDFFQRKIFTANGIFNPVVLIGGVVKGVWKRTLKKDTAVISLEMFGSLSTAQRKSIVHEANGYGNFVGKEIKVEWNH